MTIPDETVGEGLASEQVDREDLFSHGATHSAGRVLDFTALKLGLETLEADAVDVFSQAPEHGRGAGA